MGKRYHKSIKKQGENSKKQHTLPQITPEFTDKKLTNYGGLLVFAQFLNKLKFCKLVKNCIHVNRGSNSHYMTYDFVSMIVGGILCGAEHMNHVASICKDTVLQKIFDWTGSPAESTFSRFMDLLTWRHQNELVTVMSRMRRKVWDKRWLGKGLLDLDSTVKTKFGNQEGSEVGFNPHKKGAKSVHPLLCFIAGTKEILNSWLRPGDVHCMHGVVEFTKECISLLPKKIWRVVVRADSGFFSGDYFDYLESIHALFVIKVRLKNLKEILMRENINWRKAMNSDIYETASFMYKCKDWSKAKLFVAIRKLKDTNDDGFLFPIPEYEYFCYVTNLNYSPMAVHKFYGKRSTSENWIDEVKNQCAAGNFSQQNFWGSAFLFQLSILAYNLKIWMTWLTDRRSWREECKTFRFWFIKMAANLVKPGGRLILKLQKGSYYEDRWMFIYKTVGELNFT